MPARKDPANRSNSIAFWRDVRGWTIEQLADRAAVSVATISRLEVGKNRYSQDSLEKIANALRVPPAMLLIPPGPHGKALFAAMQAVLDASPEDLRRFQALIQALNAA